MGHSCKLEGHLVPRAEGNSFIEVKLPVQEIRELIKNDKRIKYETEWLIKEDGIYGQDCDKSGGEYLDVLKLIIEKVLKPKHIQLNGIVYYEDESLDPGYGRLWVSGCTIKTISGFDALKNFGGNHKTFEWNLYRFNPKYELKEKLLNFSLIGIFIDGLSNTGCDKIPAEALDRHDEEWWMKLPNEHKFLNSKVNSRYLTVMSDLEYYYRCDQKNVDKWYFVVKSYMKTLEYHFRKLSKEEIESELDSFGTGLNEILEEHVEHLKSIKCERDLEFYEKLKPLMENYNY